MSSVKDSLVVDNMTFHRPTFVVTSIHLRHGFMSKKQEHIKGHFAFILAPVSNHHSESVV